jgi:hypothetical protein
VSIWPAYRLFAFGTAVGSTITFALTITLVVPEHVERWRWGAEAEKRTARRSHHVSSGESIAIRHGWDQYAGEIEPKSEKGKRTTVIIKLLYELLVGHLQRTGRTGTDLVFGRTATSPFNINTIHSCARRAWEAARQREDEEGVAGRAAAVGEPARPLETA